MKKLLYSVLFIVLLGGLVKAQEAPRTLFGNLGNVKISGFGGPTIGIGVVDGTATAFNGGGGAVMFNNFFFGGYGTRMAVPNVNRQIGGQELRLRIQHGGIWTGYDIQAHQLIHLTTSIKFGWGNLRLYQSGTSFFDDAQSVVDENYAMLTPEVGVEVNVTRFFKIALTGGYNVGFYKNIQEDNGSNINLSGQYGALTFKFGWFGKRGPISEIKDMLRD